MPFEYFVRPFQSTDAHGRVIIPSTPSGADQRATLTWGNKTSLDAAGAKGISVSTHWPDFGEGCCKEEYIEETRKTVTMRIPDKDDPENWIEVDRPTEVKFEKKREESCNKMENWYNDQLKFLPAHVKQQYPALADKMYPRDEEPDRCDSAMKLNANTTAA